MNTNPFSSLRRPARLGVCFLLGAAALTACGEVDSPVTAGPVGASAPAAAKAYVSPEQADRAAIFAVRNAYTSPEQADRAAMLAVRAEKASSGLKVAPEAYVSPEQADRAAMLALRAERQAEQGSTEDRSHDLDLGTALARQAAAEQPAADGSVSFVEHADLSDGEG